MLDLDGLLSIVHLLSPVDGPSVELVGLAGGAEHEGALAQVLAVVLREAHGEDVVEVARAHLVVEGRGCQRGAELQRRQAQQPRHRRFFQVSGLSHYGVHLRRHFVQPVERELVSVEQGLPPRVVQKSLLDPADAVLLELTLQP